MKKTKSMLFNACKNIDFLPLYTLDGADIELVEKMKLIGLVLTFDMNFDKNTECIVQKGFKWICILKQLTNLGASSEQLINIYIKGSVLELTVPVLHSSLSIERIRTYPTKLCVPPPICSN